MYLYTNLFQYVVSSDYNIIYLVRRSLAHSSKMFNDFGPFDRNLAALPANYKTNAFFYGLFEIGDIFGMRTVTAPLTRRHV